MNLAKEVETCVRDFLDRYEIYPYSIIYTKVIGRSSSGLLAITTFLSSDIDEILDLLGYRTACDKSGYIIYRSTNTILLTGLALENLALWES